MCSSIVDELDPSPEFLTCRAAKSASSQSAVLQSPVCAFVYYSPDRGLFRGDGGIQLTELQSEQSNISLLNQTDLFCNQTDLFGWTP
jgi:hypothetical protein